MNSRIAPILILLVVLTISATETLAFDQYPIMREFERARPGDPDQPGEFTSNDRSEMTETSIPGASELPLPKVFEFLLKTISQRF